MNPFSNETHGFYANFRVFLRTVCSGKIMSALMFHQHHSFDREIVAGKRRTKMATIRRRIHLSEAYIFQAYANRFDDGKSTLIAYWFVVQLQSYYARQSSWTIPTDQDGYIAAYGQSSREKKSSTARHSEWPKKPLAMCTWKVYRARSKMYSTKQWLYVNMKWQIDTAHTILHFMYT